MPRSSYTGVFQEGHLAKECPDGDQKTCYKCGGKGHIALSCPSAPDVAFIRSGDRRAGGGESNLKDLSFSD